MDNTEPNRINGLDFLKFVAMLLITFSHFIPSILNSVFQSTSTQLLYFYDILFKTTGQLGNILFLCTAFFFMLNNDKIKSSRIINIYFNCVITMIIGLCIAEIIDHIYGTAFSPTADNVLGWIRIFFPLSTETYWFLTFYILIYIAHPILNKCIQIMNQKTHLILCIFMFFYIGLIRKIFGLTDTIFMPLVLIYFVIAYFKKYPTNIHNNIKYNLLIACLSLALLFPVLYAFHYLMDGETFFNAISTRFLLWSSIFIIPFGVSLTNVFANLKMRNSIFTKLGKKSMLCYILVNNVYIIFISLTFYYDYCIFVYFGTQYVLAWWLLGSIVYFSIGMIFIYLYSLTLSPLLIKVSNICGKTIESAIDKIYLKIKNGIDKNNNIK